MLEKAIGVEIVVQKSSTVNKNSQGAPVSADGEPLVHFVVKGKDIFKGELGIAFTANYLLEATEIHFGLVGTPIVTVKKIGTTKQSSYSYYDWATFNERWEVVPTEVIESLL